MEEEPSATCRYFCHMCSLVVRPEMGIDEVKCPHCHSGFVEEMATAEDDGRRGGNGDDDAMPVPPPWAPMLIDLLDVSSRRHGLDDGSGNLAAFARMQYRNIALLQLLSALQDGDEAGGGDTPDPGRERVLLVSPADARAMLTDGNGAAVVAASGFTLGDLFLGPGLDLLLDYLADTDPNRQGTPPAKKEAVAALPTVRVHDTGATCPVCLDEFEAGAEAREMPCKHRFHNGCILPWLEAHSSCPVCRYQLPTDDPTAGNVITAEGGSGELIGNARGGGGGDGDGGSSGRRRWLSWPFGVLFSHRSSESSSSS